MKILVIRLSSFGDIILTTPVLKALKERHRDIEIDFLVMDKFKSAIEGSKLIDNLYIFRRKEDDKIKNLKALVDKLKENRYDYVFDLHRKQRSIVISKMLGVPTFKYRKRALWKSLLVKMKAIKYKVDNTIVKSYFEPFKVLDIKYQGEDLEFQFNSKDLDSLDSNLFGLPAFAPGASKETKKWIPQEFGRLAKMIYEKYGTKVVIVGGSEDISRGDLINQISGGVCINLAGKLSLGQSGALLSKSQYLVTNDSGPFHMARGVKCPTFVIFGPTAPDLFELDKRDTLLFMNEECSPCSLHGDKVCPKGHHNCMKNLKAEEVFNTIKKKLEGGI